MILRNEKQEFDCEKLICNKANLTKIKFNLTKTEQNKGVDGDLIG